MMLQNTVATGLALAGLSHSTRLYVSSYSGNITTVNFSQKLGGLPGNLTLTPFAHNTGCSPSPSWLEFDKKTSILYCSDGDNPNPSKASFSSFQVAADGNLTLLSKITTLNGCVHSKIYENDTILAIAHYGGSGISLVDISQPASLSILQQTSFVFSDPGPDPKKPRLPFIHQTILDPTKKFLLAPDLSADLIHVFAVGDGGMLEKMPTQQDISVSNTTYLYAGFEKANMIHGYSVNYNPDRTLNFTIFQDFPLPVPKGATAAEIKLAPDNKYLIVSSRNDTGFSVPKINSTAGNMTSDSLFTFAINPTSGNFTLIQDAPAYGLGPRQFSINSNGTMVAVELAVSNRVAVIGRNVATGMMTQILGYLDLDIGGEPGLVTSVVFDEGEDELNPHNTNTTIVLSATAANSVSQAPASTAASQSPQSADPQSSVIALKSVSSVNKSPSSTVAAPHPTSTAAPASNTAQGGTFVTSPLPGGSQPTGPANNPTTNNSPTGAAGALSSATGARGAAPSPVQSIIATNCTKYHKVVSGDTCSSIVTGASIDLKEFYTWNPDVGTDCKKLLVEKYACIGVGS